MSKKQTPLYAWEKGLKGSDRDAYQAYLEEIAQAVLLPRHIKRAILGDFKEGFFRCYQMGLSIQETIGRLGRGLLGDFYQTPDPGLWYPLDSAAKVYPLWMSQSSMAVFRVAVTLKQDVDPALLQIALLATVKRFPLFATTVRKGMFWHFLDATRRRFAVEPERDMPVAPINVSGRRSPSFRVLYYEKRISLEAFHILTDGTGALAFLKTLTREYLRLTGHEVPLGADILDVAEPPKQEELANEFPRADKSDREEGFFVPPAAQIRGRRTGSQPANVIHLRMNTGDLRQAAKRSGCTVTAFLVSAMFCASAQALKSPKPTSRIHIQVPANMRAHYPSATLRNFSMYCVLQLRQAQAADVRLAMEQVKEQLREGTKKESLDRMMNSTNSLVQNPLIRYTPLPLKRLAFRVAYGTVAERVFTTTLSNIGVIQNDFGGHVDFFEVVLGPSGTNNVNCGMVSYGEEAVLTLTKSTFDPTFEDQLEALLLEYGVPLRKEAIFQ